MTQRVVLAYSGGLDTSVAVKWIQEEWGAEVVALAVDVGQEPHADAGLLGDDPSARAGRRARSRRGSSTPARSTRRAFVVNAIKANALYEGKYPLVSSLSRPVIARHLVAAAREFSADAVAHGCTGKGNDQVRFEVSTAHARARTSTSSRRCGCGASPAATPSSTRRGSTSRSRCRRTKPYSVDENIVGRAIECGAIEDPWNAPPDDIYERHACRRRRTHRAPRDRDRLRARGAGEPRRHPDAAAPDAPGARRDRRRLRLRPHRHGGEPAGRHQEPRGLRVPGRARAAARPRRSRVDHARARRDAGEEPARDRGTRRRSTTGSGTRRCARRSTRSSTRPSGTSPARCGCGCSRASAPSSAAAPSAACTTTRSPPTRPTTRSATRTPPGSCGCGACRWRRGRSASGSRSPRSGRRGAGMRERGSRRPTLWHGRFADGPDARADGAVREPVVRPAARGRRRRRLARARRDARRRSGC